MTIRFPISTKRRLHARQFAWWGFSLLEVILAVGLLGFGIAIVMHLLTNSLETLQAVRGANQALDLVPIINLKLEDPSVDIPIDSDKGGLTQVGDSNVAFQRRFFNKIFNIIKDDGAVQLLAYQYPREKKKSDDNEHGYSLGLRFIPLKPSDSELQKFFPGQMDTIMDDNPAEIYRVILSASSANAPEKLKTKPAARPDETERGEVLVPIFEKYDIENGQISGAGDKSIFVCQLQETLDPDEHLFLAIQVHIFRQSDNPSRSTSNPSVQLWDRTFHVEDRVFSYNTSMLAY